MGVVEGHVSVRRLTVVGWMAGLLIGSATSGASPPPPTSVLEPDTMEAAPPTGDHDGRAYLPTPEGRRDVIAPGSGSSDPLQTGPLVPERRVPPTSFDLAFVGDIVFGRYRDTGYDPIPDGAFDVFGAVSEDLEADVLVGNLETPLLPSLPPDSPIQSRFRFGANARDAQRLADAGFHAVSVANNHWYDLRQPGVEATPTILRTVGVVPLGTAASLEERFALVSTEVSGWRLGWVGVTTRTNAPIHDDRIAVPYLATSDLPGTVGPLLTAARTDHDLLIVVVHWGDEYADAPTPSQIRAAHGLVDAGADLVVGHHPHVLQGTEVHDRGVIAYSLGNFLFENTRDPPRLTGVLRIRASGPHCIEDVSFAPAFIRRNPVPHPVSARGHMRRKVVERLEAVSALVGQPWLDDGATLRLAKVPCPGSMLAKSP